MIKATPEQTAIVEAGRDAQDSIMIEAMAGCAKTTTLTLLAQALPVRPSLALAFGVDVKTELERRFPKHFNVKTMNGLGHVAWGRVIGKRFGIEDRKIGNLLKLFVQKEGLRTDSDDFVNVIQLVRRARTEGLVPAQFAANGVQGIFDDTDASWEHLADSLYIDINETLIWAARQVLLDSIHQAYQGVIDFDDQIYMSALFGGVFPKYPNVAVDEGQDLSPLNHIQVQRCAIDRLFVCGDPRQAIYAFRGADSSSMGSMRRMRSSWLDRTLSVTFRCPKAVVARQQEHAPGFTAAAEAPDGEVSRWDRIWSAKDIQALPGKIAILCRNNAPIMGCALRLIRSGVGCTVLGREVGKSLITLTRKLASDDFLPIAEVSRRLAEWKEREVSLARANDKEERVAIIQDKAECLNAVMSNSAAATAGALRDILVRLFSDNSVRVVLSTGHKAKGLEWDSVVHLDPWRIPSKFAKEALKDGNPVPHEQDMNLRYVIETRSKSHLILARFEDMEPND